MMKNIKSVGVLVAICAVVAVLLALTNQITAPIIKENEARKAAEALKEVLPDGDLFEEMDLSEYKGKLPATVTKVYEETAGAGYVIELTTKGFDKDMVIMCGVDPNGVVQGAKCLSSKETLGYEKTYGDNFTKKDAAGVDAVDTIGGATKTTAAYKQAIKDALNAVLVLGGAEVDLRTEEEKAVDQMKADLGATEKADLSGLPASVTDAYIGEKGCVIYLSVTGYKPDMKIVCGVSDNKIVGAVCLSSNETNGAEKTYGEHFIGKDAAGVDAVDAVASPTAPLTIKGYKQAVKDALNAAIVLSGGRTPEQILQDNLKAALPEGDTFTKVFVTEVIDGVDAVYAAANGKGYVAIIGEEFIAVDAEGNSDNAVAAAAVEAIKNSTSEDITASFQATVQALEDATTDRKQIANYRNLKKAITSVQKTTGGNYIIEIHGEGYGRKSDHGSKEYILIRAAVSADGKILDCVTLSHGETPDVGGVCATEDFTTRYDGKTEADLDAVDAIAGATMTSDGYKEALKRCLTAVTILEGGAN